MINERLEYVDIGRKYMTSFAQTANYTILYFRDKDFDIFRSILIFIYIYIYVYIKLLITRN